MQKPRTHQAVHYGIGTALVIIGTCKLVYRYGIQEALDTMMPLRVD